MFLLATMYKCRLPLSKWCRTTALASPLLESARRQYLESLPYVFPSTTTSRSGQREWDKTYGALRDLGSMEWVLDQVQHSMGCTCDFPSRACTCHDTQWLGFGKGWSCWLSKPSDHCLEATRYTWWDLIYFFEKQQKRTRILRIMDIWLLMSANVEKKQQKKLDRACTEYKRATGSEVMGEKTLTFPWERKEN